MGYRAQWWIRKITRTEEYYELAFANSGSAVYVERDASTRRFIKISKIDKPDEPFRELTPQENALLGAFITAEQDNDTDTD